MAPKGKNPLAGPFNPGPSDNAGTIPNVPAAYQPSAPEAQIVTPPRQQGQHDWFNTTMTNVDATKLNQIINQYMANFDPHSFIDGIKYQGFNREEYIKSSLAKITVHQLLRLALIGAIRGANMEKIIKGSKQMDADLVQIVKDNIVVRSARRSDDITILRCTAAIPQWVAYFMGQSAVVKKFQLACPACLQFPAAGSLPMSPRIRSLHVQFAIHFSRVIGGDFNENIYMAMFNNQISLSEISDELKLVLEAQNEQESRSVDVAAIIATELRTPARA